jgi:hypothetical protein
MIHPWCAKNARPSLHDTNQFLIVAALMRADRLESSSVTSNPRQNAWKGGLSESERMKNDSNTN